MRTKYQMNLYSIIEYTKMEKHLEKMAEQGWMLRKAGSFLWKYEEMEPKKMHFSIVFFPKTNALAPEPSEGLLMLREFCEKTGWKLAAEIGQMQIFYNEAEHPTPIETEGWVQLNNIHKTAKMAIIFPHAILLANAILQTGMQVFQFSLNPIQWLSGDYNLGLACLWIILGIGSLTELIHYVLWHKKAQEVVEEEGHIPEQKTLGVFRMIYLGLAFAVLTFSIFALTGLLGGEYGFFVLIWSVIIVGVPFGVSRLLKAKKVKVKVNIAVTCVTGLVAGVLMLISTFALIMSDEDELFHSETQMPLQISDLKEEHLDEYEKVYRVNQSIFLAHIECTEHTSWEKVEEEYIRFDYEIVYVKADCLYELCKEELLHKYDDYYVDEEELKFDRFQKVEIPVWQAEEVYQRYMGEPINEYVVCYDDMIVLIDFGWDVTEDEMQKVYEILCESR